MSADVVSRLTAALARTHHSLPLRLVIKEDDARELLRLALLADPWHRCTDHGPELLPMPVARPINIPTDPPF